jgi:alcohol dehydrogenase class IV
MGAKTGIVSRYLKPALGIIDPDVTRTLPGIVVACSGFDVLSHALESYTALPYTQRPRPASGEVRPVSQGANPFSDMACVEAMRILGANMVRAVSDPTDDEAREQMMYAAALAGIGFGNAGCHAPHGMSYAVSGLVHDFRPAHYPQDAAIVPHGMSVIMNAPSVFRFTAPACPERHLHAAHHRTDARDRHAQRPAGARVFARRYARAHDRCVSAAALVRQRAARHFARRTLGALRRSDGVLVTRATVVSAIPVRFTIAWPAELRYGEDWLTPEGPTCSPLPLSSPPF